MCVCVLRSLPAVKYSCASSMSVYVSHALIYVAVHSLPLFLSLSQTHTPTNTLHHVHSWLPAAVYFTEVLDGPSMFSANSLMLNESYYWSCRVERYSDANSHVKKSLICDKVKL